MRVIAGSVRGLQLDMIINDKAIRPTTDKVKESIFNILQFDIKGKRFLDLFGGTGQIGIEAASRGASEVIIVDNNKKSLEVIKKNISKLKGKFDIRVVCADSISFLKNASNVADIIFLDPPYGSDLLDKAFEFVKIAVNPEGIIITESTVDVDCKKESNGLKKIKDYKYGRALVSLYRVNNVKEEWAK